MQSIFWPPSPNLEKKFDLKGCQGGRSEKDESIVLKDRNFHLKLHLESHDRSWFLQQISGDIEFLQQCFEVMDYSLLIALEPLNLEREINNENFGHRKDNKVHPLAPNNEENHKKSVLPQGVHIFEGVTHRYYIGIIDIFTPYTVPQKWGRLLKTVRFCGQNHSSLPVDLYAQRFLYFVQETLE